MRSADRLPVICGLVAASLLLAGCAAIGDVFSPAKPEASASGQSTAAKTGAPAASAAKPAAADATKPEAPVNPAAQRSFDAARQALVAGRTAEAERGFIALTKSDPDLSGPYANLGLIYRQAGKTAEARAAFEKAVQLSPQRADLRNQLGITYRMAGDFAKAKASYEQAMVVDPAYAPAVLNLGILYDLYLWDGVRALELYDRYLQMTPGGDEQVQRWVRDLQNRTARKGEAPGRPKQASTAARGAEVSGEAPGRPKQASTAARSAEVSQ
ncbi:MAG TPA: tetratricopeptide repeat protein [Burkholderiaceae bacterium]|nr:tetratricopeptide repeat protein [Burkholderiaceae bacterium]